jgi:hypothetical protein
MKGLALAMFVALATTSCDEIGNYFDNSAQATDQLGFTPSVTFPDRDHSYDGWQSQQQSGAVSEESLSILFNHLAFPQSRGAVEGLLGYAFAEGDDEGYDVAYWHLQDGSELAIFFSDDQATHFTVGY